MGLIGDIGITLKVLKKGNLSDVENAEDSGKKSFLGDIDLPLKVLGDGKLLRTKRSRLRATST